MVGGGGTVLAQNLHSSGSGNDSAAGGESARSSMGADSGAMKAPHSKKLDKLNATRGRLQLPAVSSAHFVRDVRAVLAPSAYAAQSDAASDSADDSTAIRGDSPLAGKSDCTPPAGVPRKHVIPIAYDGRLAQLVTTGSGSGRTAAAYNCAGTKVLHSAPVPTR